MATMETRSSRRGALAGDGNRDPNGPGHDPLRCPGPHLTRREHEALGAITGHDSLQAAARALGISVNTLKDHLKALKRKFGVGVKSDLAPAAIALRILDGGAFPPRLTGRTCLTPPPDDNG